ncbi:NAD-dependent epimerase/dehydratase family protein [Saccharothrix syringae]|uniref:NAD(P)-dependent oxidoreductase n=1 Tax=Saccharothrix syringae TaxID=103733 RepID=A0A5Q0GUZ8_SACSY|nr:NAD(P)-dependent oxidoreductase [Saccharothrix syringae]QFZ17789.1 NAD(P)-dependent oxidoreductase [Saccharothrix syringae]
MRIFVAGATGAIGRRLVPLLRAAGHQVTGTTRTERGVALLRDLGATGVPVDVFDRDALIAAVAAAAPDVVVHQLTALSGGSPVDNALVRREGTRNLVDAAGAAGVRRIVAQSIAWAYEPGDAPADEGTPLDLSAGEPRSVSVGGVHALETAVAELAEHVVLRFGAFYGPGTWYGPDDLFGRKFRAGEFTANEGVTSFVHVDDAAAATVAALDWPSGPVNVVDDEPATAHEWAPVFAAAVGAPAPRRVTGRAPWERGARNALARGRGWEPRFPSWRKGFAELG